MSWKKDDMHKLSMRPSLKDLGEAFKAYNGERKEEVCDVNYSCTCLHTLSSRRIIVIKRGNNFLNIIFGNILQALTTVQGPGEGGPSSMFISSEGATGSASA